MTVNRWTFVLLYGSRTLGDSGPIRKVVNYLHQQYPNVVIVHGDCPSGADVFADGAAKDAGMARIKCPANWTRHGRSAGPKRNVFMIELFQPSIAIGFRHTGRSDGTDNMTSECRDSGTPHIVYSTDAPDIFAVVAFIDEFLGATE